MIFALHIVEITFQSNNFYHIPLVNEKLFGAFWVDKVYQGIYLGKYWANTNAIYNMDEC